MLKSSYYFLAQKETSSHSSLYKKYKKYFYISTIRQIELQKWYTTIQVKIRDFQLTTTTLRDSAAVLNCIQEELIPFKYFEKTKESLRSANGSKMNINYEISKAHVCQNTVYMF